MHLKRRFRIPVSYTHLDVYKRQVHTLFPEEVPLKMWSLPIGELFMAGRSSVEALKKLEIDTIGELANADLGLIELHLKSHGKMLVKQIFTICFAACS